MAIKGPNLSTHTGTPALMAIEPRAVAAFEAALARAATSTPPVRAVQYATPSPRVTASAARPAPKATTPTPRATTPARKPTASKPSTVVRKSTPPTPSHDRKAAEATRARDGLATAQALHAKSIVDARETARDIARFEAKASSPATPPQERETAKACLRLLAKRGGDVGAKATAALKHADEAHALRLKMGETPAPDFTRRDARRGGSPTLTPTQARQELARRKGA